jgi:hypothetical protein
LGNSMSINQYDHLAVFLGTVEAKIDITTNKKQEVIKMKKTVYLMLSISLSMAGCAGLPQSYLYKPGVTTETMAADYKDCKFKSLSLNQNNQIVNNIADSHIKNSKNAAQYKEFMSGCINQKGYELYNERYMQTVKNWDANVYKNTLQGFFWREMTSSDIIDYVKNGNIYHTLGPDNKELKIDETYLAGKTSGNK